MDLKNWTVRFGPSCRHRIHFSTNRGKHTHTYTYTHTHTFNKALAGKRADGSDTAARQDCAAIGLLLQTTCSKLRLLRQKNCPDPCTVHSKVVKHNVTMLWQCTRRQALSTLQNSSDHVMSNSHKFTQLTASRSRPDHGKRPVAGRCLYSTSLTTETHRDCLQSSGNISMTT